MSEIAERAGVSLMTVSRVLNGHPDVAPGTRDAVLRHAEALGYAGRHARLPRRDRMGFIAASVPFIGSEGDYYASILSGAADELVEHGAYLVLCPTRQEHDRETGLLVPLLQGRTDGALLISPAESPAELLALRDAGYAFVVIDPALRLDDTIPVIAAMDMAGARMATDCLISLGHRRIGIITGPLPWVESADRLAGYHAALAAAGLPLAPDLVEEANFTVHGGEQAAQQLLSLTQPPTAIFACNDNMAVGVLRAAAARGLRVPGDLSVIGFDDVEATSLVTPTITTVRQPLKDMGRAAVDLLYRVIDGQPIEVTHIEVATRLIVRESTGPPGSA